MFLEGYLLLLGESTTLFEIIDFLKSADLI